MYLCFINFQINKNIYLPCILVFKLMVQNFVSLVKSSQSVSQNGVYRPAALEPWGVGELINYSFPHVRISGEGPGRMYFKENPAMVTSRNTDLQYNLKNNINAFPSSNNDLKCPMSKENYLRIFH